MNRIKEIKGNEIIKYICLAIALALFFVVNAKLAMLHEPWRDEAQTYQLARDLNLSGILSHANDDGHPMLWITINYLFEHYLGVGIVMQQISALVLTTAAAILLLFMAPKGFWWPLRILFVLSPIMVYHLPVIARNYCLIPVIVFGLATLFPKRFEHPVWYSILLGLLVQTHIIMIGAAFAMSFWFMVELWQKGRKENAIIKNLMPLFIPFFSALFLIIELTPITVTGETGATLSQMLFRMLVYVEKLSAVTIGDRIVPNKVVLYGFILVMAISLILSIVRICSHKSQNIDNVSDVAKNNSWNTLAALLVYLFYLFAQIFIESVVYNGATQRQIQVYLMLGWLVWILSYEKDFRLPRILTGALLTVALVCTCTILYEDAINDKEGLYSAAEETANWIKDNLEADAILYTSNICYTQTIDVYLEDRPGIEIRDAFHGGEKVTYVDYVTYNMEGDSDINQWRDSEKPVYMINPTIMDFLEGQMEPLFESNSSYTGESYRVYRWQ